MFNLWHISAQKISNASCLCCKSAPTTLWFYFIFKNMVYKIIGQFFKMGDRGQYLKKMKSSKHLLPLTEKKYLEENHKAIKNLRKCAGLEAFSVNTVSLYSDNWAISWVWKMWIIIIFFIFIFLVSALEHRARNYVFTCNHSCAEDTSPIKLHFCQSGMVSQDENKEEH